MKKVTLTQIEVSDIQNYVFGSNNLRQNIGASELVARATGEWVTEALNSLPGSRHNAKWSDEAGFVSLSDQSLTAGGLQAEVVYTGGGSALILFAGAPEKYAVPFTKTLTRRIVTEARGLNVIVGHTTFDWDADALSAQHQKLRRQISRQNLARQPDTPLPGLSVTAAGDFTGLPAVGKDSDGRLISTEAQHKLARSAPLEDAEQDKQKESATHRLQKILQGHLRPGYQFVRDFDLFCEKGEASYIAVVHIDGNGMGKRFQKIARAHPAPADNAAYLRQLRAMSRAVREKSVAALKAAVDLLFYGLDQKKFPLKHGRRHLPFRPVIFGGDDATFIADGSLGLALTVKYLQTLAQGILPGAKKGDTGDPLYARAGIAIVKTHYPFSRAYELSESLAKSAKEELKELPDEKGITLDWHISGSGVVLPLKELRRREYLADTGHSLLMRPLRLDPGDPPVGSKYWRSWRNFDNIIYRFQSADEWADKRNKIMALREALRQGPEATLRFRKNFEQGTLPAIPGQSQMAETGWNGGECGYFDAIEALDFYKRL